MNTIDGSCRSQYGDTDHVNIFANLISLYRLAQEIRQRLQTGMSSENSFLGNKPEEQNSLLLEF